MGDTEISGVLRKAVGMSKGELEPRGPDRFPVLVMDRAGDPSCRIQEMLLAPAHWGRNSLLGRTRKTEAGGAVKAGTQSPTGQV